MATTNLIPLHVGKKCTAGTSIARVIQYVKNPEKTQGESLVSGYGCNPALADAEFMYMKKTYLDRTGRYRGKDDVIAYHMRQAFMPGEITPEEANRLGQELAQRFTHGNHAYIVATHTDRHHIHNHIIISAVNLDCDRKFRNFVGSSFALRRLNDVICIENGYSVIEHPKKRGQRYNKWMETYRVAKAPSQRDTLRAAIENALAKHPKDLPELLSLLQAEGWEIKNGKHIAVRGPDQERFKRLDSLEEGYTQDDLIQRIASGFRGEERKSPFRKKENPIIQATPHKVNLLVDIQARLQKAKSPGYERWAKGFNLKEMAKTFSYLREHGLLDRAELDRCTDEASAKTENTMKRIRVIEDRQREIGQIKTHIIQYSKTREIYAQYKKSNWSPKYAAQHEQEIAMHRAAKKAFDALGMKKLPKVADLNAEYESLQSEKNALYADYKRDRAEMRQLLIVQENVRRILDAEPQQDQDISHRHIRG